VLEFGPAYGRLTKYVKENLKCNVTVVEIDEDAAKTLQKFADRCFVGVEEGDIEKYYWEKKLEEEKFDYIIFADVLEHLYNPKEVLERSKKFLKEDGSILISIPNISHNSVIIDLINDEFKYREVGLMDDTHIRFFTCKSFKRMISEIRLMPVKEEATYVRVGETEFSNRYEAISKNISKELKKRDMGNIYQYVFELKERDYVFTESIQRYVNLDRYSGYECICYVKEINDEIYREDKVVKCYFVPESRKVEFDLSYFDNIKDIRLDPIDTNCVLKIKNVYIGNKENIYRIDIKNTNASYSIENIYFFKNNDPQIYFNYPSGKFNRLIFEFEFLDYDIEEFNKFDKLIECFSKKTDAILYTKEKTENELMSRQEELDKTKEVLITKETELNKTKELMLRREEELNEVKKSLLTKEKEFEEIILKKEDEMDKIRESLLDKENELSRTKDILFAKEKELNETKDILLEMEEKSNETKDALLVREKELSKIKKISINKENEINKAREIILKKEDEMDKISKVLLDREKELSKTKKTLLLRERELNEAKKILCIKETGLNSLKERFNKVEEQLEIMRRELSNKETELNEIKNTRTWRLRSFFKERG